MHNAIPTGQHSSFNNGLPAPTREAAPNQPIAVSEPFRVQGNGALQVLDLMHKPDPELLFVHDTRGHAASRLTLR